MRTLLPMICLLVVSSRASALQAQASPTPGASFLASAFSDWRTGPDGVARMNLVGDSTAPTGLSAFRLRYGANVGKDSSKALVHFHMGTQHILVLKGTLVVGFGEQVDYSTVKEYGAEGFVVIPSGRPHYHWTRGETEIQVEATGPSGTVPWPRIQRPIGTPAPPPFPKDSTHIWPNGLPEWTLNPNGSARLNLAGGRPPSTTELIGYRTHRPAMATTDTTRIIYHYHFGTEHITVIKGVMYFGIGEKADRSKARAYGPGSFIENPSGAKHFEWFSGETVTQVSAVGSLGSIPLDPATGQPR
jgi:quercetin dioxygenase-like cupin family protein